jgi:hypothetical protein
MQIEGFWFPVEVKLRITKAELDHMIECSKAHYDYKCKAASKRGGFLYGWRNRLEGDIAVAEFSADEQPDSVEVQASWHTVDTLCKILEMEGTMDVLHKVLVEKAPPKGPRLHSECHYVLNQMREKLEEVNSES